MYTIEDVENYKKAQSLFFAEQEKLQKRIDEILQLICNFFQTTMITNWWFSDAMEGEVGTCDLNISDEDEISLYMASGFEFNYDGWDYNQGFPKKFLVMSDDDMVEYLTAEKEAQDLKAEKKKKKKKKAAEIRKQKKQEALSQLTPEQIKVLGLG